MKDFHGLDIQVPRKRRGPSGRQKRRRRERAYLLLQRCDGRLQLGAADLDLKVAGVVEVGTIDLVRHRDAAADKDATQFRA